MQALLPPLLFLSFFPSLLAVEDPVTVVTYGSTIKLEHAPTSHRLHSHDVSYGTGSGQQSVTAFPHGGDSNSLWIVRESHSAPQPPSGTPIKCNDVIRLQHLNTGKNLHSHEHRAPMNRDNEVSAYAAGHDRRWAVGDDGDNWILECDGKEWKRFENVRLKHEEKGVYLTANAGLRFGEPIPNQLQVSGGSRRNSNTAWKTNEGVYIAPIKETQ